MTTPRTNAGHDQNFVPTLLGVSTIDGTTPVPVEVDPTTGQLQVSSTGGGSSSTVWGLNDKEDTGTYVYYGFSAADGSWKLLRKTSATNVFRYSTGASGYSAAWTNRASQTYDTYDVTF